MVQSSDYQDFSYQTQKEEDQESVLQPPSKDSLIPGSTDISQENVTKKSQEEDIDHLLTDLFKCQEDCAENETDAGTGSLPVFRFELPKPEEIGLTMTSIQYSVDSLLSSSFNKNKVWSGEPWRLFANNEFNLQNYSFPDLNLLEDQDELDTRGLIVNTLVEEPELVVHKVQDAFLGPNTSTLDENTKKALKVQSIEELTQTSQILDDNNINFGLLQDMIEGGLRLQNENQEISSDTKTQLIEEEVGKESEETDEPEEKATESNTEKNPPSFGQIVENDVDDHMNGSPTDTKHDENPADLTQCEVTEIEEPTESPSDSMEVEAGESESADCPLVGRPRRGRKRRQGTVVDLLVSSYVKKRSTRCRVGTFIGVIGCLNYFLLQTCGPCKAPDCGECIYCLDKPKFGGPNKKKNACLERKCLNMIHRVSPNASLEESLPLDQDEIPVDVIGHTPGTEENLDLSCNETLDEFIAETIGVKLAKEQTPERAFEIKEDVNPEEAQMNVKHDFKSGDDQEENIQDEEKPTSQPNLRFKRRRTSQGETQPKKRTVKKKKQSLVTNNEKVFS